MMARHIATLLMIMVVAIIATVAVTMVADIVVVALRVCLKRLMKQSQPPAAAHTRLTVQRR